MLTLSSCPRLLLLASLSLAACKKNDSKPENCAGSCSTPATVRDLTGLDGCGKVLVLRNGKRLEPQGAVWNNFAATDSQQVYISYAPVSGASICMVGELVELDCIRSADAQGN